MDKLELVVKLIEEVQADVRILTVEVRNHIKEEASEVSRLSTHMKVTWFLMGIILVQQAAAYYKSIGG